MDAGGISALRRKRGQAKCLVTKKIKEIKELMKSGKQIAVV